MTASCLLDCCSLGHLIETNRDEPLHQGHRESAPEREPEGATIGLAPRRDALDLGDHPTRMREVRVVVREAVEPRDDFAVQPEARHPVRDALLRIGKKSGDCGTQMSQRIKLSALEPAQVRIDLSLIGSARHNPRDYDHLVRILDNVYVPRHFRMNEADTLSMIQESDTGHLVTASSDRLESTFLPYVLDHSDDSLRILAHISRANPQRLHIEDGREALLIIPGPNAYVSPSWYPGKIVHHEVVPTWAYTLVHVRGTIRRVEGAAELTEIVRRLTERHEAQRDEHWMVDDAPENYIKRLIRGIIGIELTVTSIDAKAKLIQDDPVEDQHAVKSALLAGGPDEIEVGRLMRPGQV